MRTEDRPKPTELTLGDRLTLGPLQATVEAALGHPMLVRRAFDGSLSPRYGRASRATAARSSTHTSPDS